MNLSNRHRAILQKLDEAGGFTTARIAKNCFPKDYAFNARMASGATRSWLMQLYKAGLVMHLDNLKPTCWCLTSKGAIVVKSK